jgi:hypothetical protein
MLPVNGTSEAAAGTPNGSADINHNRPWNPLAIG